jgi:molybdopterin/thiamine biosynthesis adenylyltransferase
MLANMLYRACGVKMEVIDKKLTAENADKFLENSQLVIDTFDNSVGRADVKNACLALGIPCVHAGMAGDYAEVIWNADYRVPSDANDDVCDYPLARNLAGMTTAVACEVAIAFMLRNEQNSYTITLGDFAVRAFEPVI